MQCLLGGFVNFRHDSLKSFFASFMSPLYPDTRVEPHLRQLNEDEKKTLQSKYNTSKLTDRPRGDISALGFWQEGQRAFFDLRVWNHLSLKYLGKSLEECHRDNEQEKERENGDRIRHFENGAFTALSFSSMASAGSGARDFLNTLATRASEVQHSPLPSP